MSDPFWLLKPPYTLFDSGMIMLIMAVIYTYVGKVGLRGGGWIYRAKEPRRYWRAVAMCYLSGVFLIGLFLYEIRVFSN